MLGLAAFLTGLFVTASAEPPQVRLGPLEPANLILQRVGSDQGVQANIGAHGWPGSDPLPFTAARCESSHEADEGQGGDSLLRESAVIC